MKFSTALVRATRAVTTAGCLLIAGSATCAAEVQAQFNPLGGNAWAAAFIVSATGVQVIESFTIYLDASLIGNVALQASPAQWDTLVVQADPALASDAFVDALLTGPDAIHSAAPLAGFEITFNWLGAAAPGALRFTVNDAVSFAVLETGSTVPFGAAAVPEPWSLALVGVALGLAAGGTLRRPVR